MIIGRNGNEQFVLTVKVWSNALSKGLQNTAYAVCIDTLYITYKLWLWKILSAVAEYMYKTYKRWWLSIKTSLLNSCNILNLDSWILKLMNFFPELIHIAAHLPKVVLRVAEGSTEKEEEEDWIKHIHSSRRQTTSCSCFKYGCNVRKSLPVAGLTLPINTRSSQTVVFLYPKLRGKCSTFCLSIIRFKNFCIVLQLIQVLPLYCEFSSGRAEPSCYLHCSRLFFFKIHRPFCELINGVLL